MPCTVQAPRRGQRLKMLWVECLPAELRQVWSLQQERQRLGAALPAAPATDWQVLRNPTLAELVTALQDGRPQLVHFAGLDSHQGLRELRTAFGETALVDLGPTGRPDKPASPSSASPGTTPTDTGTAPETTRLVDAVMADRRLMVDGVLLRSEQGYPRLVRAMELAEAMGSSGHTAFLVTLNLWNTAARVAPLLVAQGATAAAVGFQDAFDDALAEFL
ncbi:MAG: hypothetical protein CFE45_38070, partial [Burkholderiales bacterium PBB5]